MTVHVVKKTGDFVLRLREQDTPNAISGFTLEKLMTVTGMTKTELTHMALRKLADAFLPHYERDDGPLTTAQIRAIRERSTASGKSEERFNKSLL
ncbi:MULTISPECIES: hypothetical protein [Serratia]|uniref:hypothetical protein n=1 Tax=Serratia TaxID=613 RepID=UPI0029D89AAA|nr:hypothetical protein [Serratia marcescens]MDX7489833.1 hypothetical protein [Serratia marcescens]BEL72415.1 hypothetical protein SM10VA4_34390 [Serratia marcescens]